MLVICFCQLTLDMTAFSSNHNSNAYYGPISERVKKPSCWNPKSCSMKLQYIELSAWIPMIPISSFYATGLKRAKALCLDEMYTHTFSILSNQSLYDWICVVPSLMFDISKSGHYLNYVF